jgi:hypothetical protein
MESICFTCGNHTIHIDSSGPFSTLLLSLGIHHDNPLSPMLVETISVYAPRFCHSELVHITSEIDSDLRGNEHLAAFLSLPNMQPLKLNLAVYIQPGHAATLRDAHHALKQFRYDFVELCNQICGEREVCQDVVITPGEPDHPIIGEK